MLGERALTTPANAASQVGCGMYVINVNVSMPMAGRWRESTHTTPRQCGIVGGLRNGFVCANVFVAMAAK
jgi:hypothetical protein